MLRHAKILLSDLHKAEIDLVAASGGHVGSLTIGCFTMYSKWPLAQAVHQFRQAHPHVITTLEVETHETLINALDADKLDIVISRCLPNVMTQSYRSIFLLQEETVLVCNASHPLAQQTQVTLNECVQFPWITGHLGSHIRTILKEKIQAAQCQEPDLIGALSLDFCSEMLVLGDYLWMVPSSTARYLHTSGNVSVLPISLDLLPAPLGAIWRRDRISRQQVHLFVEVLKDVIKAAGASDDNTMLAMPDELH